jgi:hypothetical protein
MRCIAVSQFEIPDLEAQSAVRVFAAEVLVKSGTPGMEFVTPPDKT